MDCTDASDKDLDSTFRATRLEFIILQREEEEDMVNIDDYEMELDIPDQDTFDEVVADAVFHFTANVTDRSVNIIVLELSSYKAYTSVDLGPPSKAVTIL